MVDEDLTVQLRTLGLSGRLTVPTTPSGLVVFAHGSGSSRHSPRNLFVARQLNRAGLGTLLFDLLSSQEETDRANVFNIPLLAERLLATTEWLTSRMGAERPLGYFGASTGAAAALWAAGEADPTLKAVVSRGGRPDLALDRLREVRAATLLIVGGRDSWVLELNRLAAAQLRCEFKVKVVGGASHLFEEPGALEKVAELAVDWFQRHLGGATPPTSSWH
jgi:dienelactone hydrolase